MTNAPSKEKQFLGGVVKVVAALAAAILIAYGLDGVLPGTVVRFLSSAVGLLGIFWAVRGTSFDPFATRSR